MTFKEVVSHVTYCALFSQFSCHCHVISAHSRLSAYQKRRCAVVLSLEVLVLGLVGFEVAHHDGTMWPNHSHPGQEPKRERERARGKGSMVSLPPGVLMSCWATMGICIQEHIHTRMQTYTHT